MLKDLSVEIIFNFILILARVGMIFSLLPGFSEKYVLAQVRLILALSMSIIVYTTLLGQFPLYSNIAPTYIIIEMLTGAFLGLISRIFLTCIHLLGTTISMQSSLSAANFFDPAHAMQQSVFNNLFAMTFVATLFATDSHHILIEGVVKSYTSFPLGRVIDIGDASNFLTSTFSKSFAFGFQISSPFIIVNLAMQVGSGILARLMPNLHVFFIIMPSQILVMFFVLMITINYITMKVIDHLTLLY